MISNYQLKGGQRVFLAIISTLSAVVIIFFSIVSIIHISFLVEALNNLEYNEINNYQNFFIIIFDLLPLITSGLALTFALLATKKEKKPLYLLSIIFFILSILVIVTSFII